MLNREQMLCFSLGAAMRRISKIYADSLAQFEVTPPQLFLLTCLGDEDGQKPSDLSEKVCLDSSSLTGLLDRTAKAGWLERRPDAEDRRAVRVYLTPAGRELLSSLGPALEEVQKKVEAEFFQDYDADQVAMFQEMLIRMREVTE